MVQRGKLQKLGKLFPGGVEPGVPPRGHQKVLLRKET